MTRGSGSGVVRAGRERPEAQNVLGGRRTAGALEAKKIAPPGSDRQGDLFAWIPPAGPPSSPPSATSQSDLAVADPTKLRPARSAPEHLATHPPHPPGERVRGGEVVVGTSQPEPRSREVRCEGAGAARSAARSTGHEPRSSEPTDLPPAALTPRPYQVAAISESQAGFETGCRSQLVVMPTGTGKTVVFAMLAELWHRAGDRTLILAHRDELLEQAQNKLRDVGLSSEREQGTKRASTNASIVVASVQTLQRRRLASFPRDYFRRIVVDEAHHAPAKSYRAIFDHFADAKILGVTATPDRADGKALRACFERVAFRYELREAIRDEFLVPLVARRVLVAGLDLSRVRVHHGDLDQRELSELLSAEKPLHETVTPLLELAGDRRTIVFAVDVAHARRLAEIANRHRPGCAIAVDGSASDDERKRALAAFRAGDHQFLVNCALYTEGFDEPSVACVAVVRPTQSRALYTQMLGRVTRLLGLTYAESIRNGKRDGLVLDFAGVTKKHSLAGPADALAGVDLEDELRGEIERRIAEQFYSVDDAIRDARAAIEQRRQHASVTAGAEYRVKQVDPFLAQFFPQVDGAWVADPATPEQRRALKKAGFDKLPEGLTKGEASKWLAAIRRRSDMGLATVPQARALERAGLDTNNPPMSFARARQLIIALSTRGHRALRLEPEYRGSRKERAE